MIVATLDAPPSSADRMARSIADRVRALGGEVVVRTGPGGTRCLEVRLEPDGLERLGVALALAGVTPLVTNAPAAGHVRLVVIAGEARE